MILLLGARGYIGQAFARELRARGERFIPLSRATLDYTRFELLFEYVRKMEPDFLINAGGIWGKPNVDACENTRVETFQANTLLPQTITRVCTMTNTPWGHVSSACIYSGAKVWVENPKSEIPKQPRKWCEPRKGAKDAKGAKTAGQEREYTPEGQPRKDTNYTKEGIFSPAQGLRVERDLETPRMRRLFAEHPEYFAGFNETDEPNFCFRSPPCNYMAGTKALAEERLKGIDGLYVWRIGRPFNEELEPENLFSRLISYRKVFDHFAAVSRLEDFVRGCVELMERRAAYGVYNVTNPGAVRTREIVELIEHRLERQFEFWSDAEEFYRGEERAPRSSCIIDSEKMSRAGVRMRPAKEALAAAVERWAEAASERDRGRGEPLLRVV